MIDVLRVPLCLVCIHQQGGKTWLVSTVGTVAKYQLNLCVVCKMSALLDQVHFKKKLNKLY